MEVQNERPISGAEFGRKTKPDNIENGALYISITRSISSSINGSTTLCWALAPSSVS
jgi:hypothetical protein